MNAEDLIFARPHFRYDDGKLHFFLSERVFRALTPEEDEVWHSVQGASKRRHELPDGPAVDALVAAGVLERVVPVARGSRRRVLVVEPHADDAALSIGGTMWKLRERCDFHLLTLASETNYTSDFHLRRGFLDRARVTAMRRIENEIFVAHLGGSHASAGLNEATLRYRNGDWSLDFLRDHRVAVSASNNRRVEPEVLAQWCDLLRRRFGAHDLDEIWIPLGAGTHGDHDLTRDAALAVIREQPPTATVRLYEDVPYGSDFPEHTRRLLELFETGGSPLEPWIQDITAEYEKKLALLSIYASQFKVDRVSEGVERSARDGERRVERLWTMRTPPPASTHRDLWIGAPAVAALMPCVRRFRERAATIGTVSIFAINAAGRWPSDLARLKEAFPRARFMVYAGPTTRAEFDAARDDRVRVRAVSGTPTSWLVAALREFFARRRVIIAGAAMRKAEFLRRLWPYGESLVVAEMDTLYQALGIAGEAG